MLCYRILCQDVILCYTLILHIEIRVSLYQELLESTTEGETTLAHFDAHFEATLRLLARKIEDRFGTTAAAFRYVAPGR